VADRANLWAWLGRVVLWVVPCFALWYYVGRLADPVSGRLAVAFINVVGNGVIETVETGASQLTFVTRLPVGGGGVLTVDADSRIYSYGVPFAMALILAAWPRGIAWRLALVVVTLFPLVAWGVTFDVLGTLVRAAPGWTAAVLGQWGATGVAIGYQFGSLIFPGLVPAAVAVGLSWQKLGR